ncbi:gliding motility-associated lipoprotein GldH [Mucilaginibacter gossypiicola]|uniref:Gliding motility-associated lipoprotein GldH n=1 Tax=Mucilaginibacter gossypiicola TaxID=551995 RepID=A0A1H8EUP6_9SPHI|nr:gliding motility lipoprotein GldH [Mucilaginibacter gossypiicola]SEN23203.1 gliding motility-associated lipoprotein GldH [Mucilaginibacter gossypiicola]
MKRALNIIYPAALLLITMLAGSCTDPNSIIDTNTEIADHNWSYVNRANFDVKINDEKVAYNQYLNLRVTGNYKYSNIFVLVNQISPDKKAHTTRFEVKLANPDGEWLGKGSGNLYSYQVLLRKDYHFPAKGIYRFQIEQNMRDNPLHEISDVGLRVEKAQ